LHLARGSANHCLVVAGQKKGPGEPTPTWP
jgi:hypothetical protein